MFSGKKRVTRLNDEAVVIYDLAAPAHRAGLVKPEAIACMLCGLAQARIGARTSFRGILPCLIASASVYYSDQIIWSSENQTIPMVGSFVLFFLFILSSF